MIDAEKLRQIYADMFKVRLLRKQASARSRGTRSQHVFSEACEVACTIDLTFQDTIAISPRQNFLRATREPHALEREFSGPQTAERGSSPNLFIYEDPAARLMLATGIAFAHQCEKKNKIVIAFAGGDDESEIQRSLQFAFDHRLPIIYVQQRSLSGARKRSNSRKRPQLPTIPVDQNDAIAVFRVACEAIDKARRGVGPTVIDAIEPQSRSSASNHNNAQHHDPLEYMEWYLRRRNLWSDELKHGGSGTSG